MSTLRRWCASCSVSPWPRPLLAPALARLSAMAAWPGLGFTLNLCGGLRPCGAASNQSRNVGWLSISVESALIIIIIIMLLFQMIK